MNRPDPRTREEAEAWVNVYIAEARLAQAKAVIEAITMNVYTPTMTTFKVGDAVERRHEAGLRWTGTVVAVFFTRGGEVRYVVEHAYPVDGTLHIYNAGHMREIAP